MNRRFFCAGLAAINAPYLARAQSTTILRGYIPLPRRGGYAGQLSQFIEKRFRDETSGEASLSLHFLGELRKDSALQNTRGSDTDFEITFNESGFRNHVAASHLFSSLSLQTPNDAKVWYESESAQEACAEISDIEELKISPAGNCMEVGLGYFKNVIENILPENLDVTITSPVILTNFGWSKVWRRLGIRPIVMAPSHYYDKVYYYDSGFNDIIGAQYASMRSASTYGGEQLFDFLYTDKTFNTAPIQLLAAKGSVASELHTALENSIRLASQDMLADSQTKREESIQRMEQHQTIVMNENSDHIVGKIMSAWERTKEEDSASNELAARIISSQST